MEAWLNVKDPLGSGAGAPAWRDIAMVNSTEAQLRLICQAGSCVDLSEARRSRWTDTVELLNGQAPGYLMPLLVLAEA